MKFSNLKIMLFGIGLMVFGIALGVMTIGVSETAITRMLIRGFPILGLIVLLLGLILGPEV